MAADEHPKSHLVLVGLPGAGKTTVGRALAARLARPFLDFDEEIERRQGMTVAALFAERGEPAFRALERALTAELAGREPMVLAPGGGWVTNAGVIELLRPPAQLVYLRLSPAAALARLGGDRDSRPLLRRPDPLAALTALLAGREPLYLGADYVLDADGVAAQELAARVARLVRPG